MNLTRNTYLTTEAAAARIDQQLKDWVTSHSPKREQAATRRQLSHAKTGGNFHSQRLGIMSSRLQRSPFRRCNSYYITHRNTEETGYTYQAGIHIFTIDQNLLSGVIGHVYASDQEPPDNVEWSVEERIEAFQQIFLNADQERYRAMEQTELTMDNEGRELPTMPGVYILLEQGADGEEQARTERLRQIQEASPRAKVLSISERGIINAAREMNDDQLRPWLNASYRMVAIRESGERRFSYPEQQELAHASEAEARAMDDHNSAQAICAMIRNMLILSTMSQAEPGSKLTQELDEAAMVLLSETGGKVAPSLTNLQLGLLASRRDGPTAADVNEVELELRRNGDGIEPTEEQPDPADQDKDKEIERLNSELNDFRQQVANLQEALRYSGQQAPADPVEDEPEDTGATGGQRASRSDLVLEAITDPARFPRLRFLAPAQEVASYGKARPHGEEIIAALDAINQLADQYYEKQGKVGNWADHFQLPGWNYSPRDSQTTMGKHQDERTFTDHESGNRVVIDRHMTYPTGRYGGMQIYFDQDDATGKFIVAYIGSHKTAAHERS